MDIGVALGIVTANKGHSDRTGPGPKQMNGSRDSAVASFSLQGSSFEYSRASE